MTNESGIGGARSDENLMALVFDCDVLWWRAAELPFVSPKLGIFVPKADKCI